MSKENERLSFAQQRRKLVSVLGKQGAEDVFVGSANPKRIPTRFLRFDRELGGGLPEGRIIELFGWEEGYKSTFALYLMHDVVAATGKRPLLLDHEHRFMEMYPKSLGLFEDWKWPLNEWLVQPRHFEQGTEICLKLLETGEVGIVVMDSIAALPTKDEQERGMEDTNMAYKARKMAQFMPKLVPTCSTTGAVFIGVNQLRQKPGVQFGDPTYTPGGKTMKFHASIRLALGRSKVKDKPDESNVTIRFKKNSITGRHSSLVYHCHQRSGFDLSGETLDLAVEAGIVKSLPGKGYVFPSGKAFKRREEAAEKADKARGMILAKVTKLVEKP